jgi:hypothetical protein
MKLQDNRRQYGRVKLDSRVVYSPVGSEESREARLIDMGYGGLCMESSLPVRTGTLLYLQLVDLHPEAGGLAAHRSYRGRVRWTKDLGDMEKTRYGIGIQYIRATGKL